jgi:phosphoribosylanthranilate isomerase
MSEHIVVKICGTTTPGDARLAAEAGADLVGVILAPSPRRIDAAQARAIRQVLPDEVRLVGVFVNAPAAEINEIAESVGLDMVQLHGDETPETAAAVQRPWIKALRVRDGEVQHADAWAHAEHLLLDTWDETLQGGSGRTFPWGAAVPLSRAQRVILSGGLNPVNVGSAIGAVRPYGVDATSGLESSPGRKDPHLVRRFVSAVRRLERMHSADPLAGAELATEDYR